MFIARRLVSLAAYCPAAGGGGGPPVFDAGSDPASVGSGASLSWSHTCTGDDRALIVGAEIWNIPSSVTATYNGVSMTSVAVITSDAQAQYCEMFKLSAPASGANTVLITPNVSEDEMAGVAMSFTNAHQTTASLTGTPVTAAACTTGISVGSASDELVVDVAGSYASALEPNASNTERADCGFTGAANMAGSTKAGDTSVTMDWTATSAAGHIGVSIITS